MSSLFDVTTFFPDRRAFSTTSREGFVPPMHSTTMEISASSSTSSARVAFISGGTAISNGRAEVQSISTSRFTRTGRPTLRSMFSWLSSKVLNVPVPIFP